MDGMKYLANVRRWLEFVESVSDRDSREAGLALGAALLALSPEALEAWAQERAKGAAMSKQYTNMRDFDHVARDWEDFSRHFGLPSRKCAPDTGSVLGCLHMMIDSAMGLEVSYAC